ncbi:hypothetical protein B566_EDAN003988 [Ephemera danica]|nr:hypothetical protein B566_EDAN003988 [Ephemera danica]
MHTILRMWHLRRADTGAKFYLLGNCEYKIGTLAGHHDLVIEGPDGIKKDSSISRRHAVIKVNYCKEDEDSIERLPEVTVCDLKSTYGTFINEGIDTLKKIENNHNFRIRKDDRIRFGRQWNVWQLGITPLIVVPSTLSAEGKKEARDKVVKLGGHFVENWSPECTYLTMEVITMTAKVVCALAQGVPIVTPNFWSAWYDAVTLKKDQNGHMKQDCPPNPEDFLPTLNENRLRDTEVSLFSVNLNRKTLFKGKTFLFLRQKQYHRFFASITAAGGKAEIWRNSNMTVREKCSDNVIIVQQMASDAEDTQYPTLPDDYNEVMKLLASKKMRKIPEDEIGLAILYCSMETRCNPHFQPEVLIRSKKDHKDDKTGVTLAIDTQDSPTVNTVPEATPTESKKRPSNILESLDEVDEHFAMGNAPILKKSRIEDSATQEKETSITISQMLRKPSLPVGSILTFKDVDEHMLFTEPKTSDKNRPTAVSSSSLNMTQNSSIVNPREDSAKTSRFWNADSTASDEEEEDVFGFDKPDTTKYVSQSGSNHKKPLSTQNASNKGHKRAVFDDKTDSEDEMPTKVARTTEHSDSEEDVFNFEPVKQSPMSLSTPSISLAPKAHSTQKVVTKSQPIKNVAPPMPDRFFSNNEADDTEWLVVPHIKQRNT